MRVPSISLPGPIAIPLAKQFPSFIQAEPPPPGLYGAYTVFAINGAVWLLDEPCDNGVVLWNENIFNGQTATLCVPQGTI